MDKILQDFSSFLEKTYPSLVDNLISPGEGLVNLFGFNPGARTFFAAAAWSIIREKEKDRQMIIVCQTNSQAETTANELLHFIPPAEVSYFPGYGTIPYDYVKPSADHDMFRMRTFSRILQGADHIIVTSLEALMRRIPAESVLKKEGLLLEKGKDYNLDAIQRTLLEFGYQREAVVETYGHFARKGDVIDIYSPFSDDPVRLDFFDTSLESLRTFNAREQLSLEALDSFTVYPRRELLLSDEQSARLLKLFEKGQKDARRLPMQYDLEELAAHVEEERYVEGLEELFPAVMPTAGLLDLFHERPAVLWYNHEGCCSRWDNMRSEFQILYEKRNHDIVCLEPSELLLHEERARAVLQTGFTLDSLATDTESIELPFRQAPDFKGRLSHFKETLGFLRKEDSQKQGDVNNARGSKAGRKKKSTPDEEPVEGDQNLDGGSSADEAVDSAVDPASAERENEAAAATRRELLGELFTEEQDHRLFIISPYEAQLSRLEGLFSAQEKVDSLQFRLAGLESGFSLPACGIHIWTDANIFGRSYRRKSRFKKTTSRLIDSFLDLNPGDPVVHVQHGIGIFKGLKRIEAAGKLRDFLVLAYKDDGVLYVPLDQISQVQRYIGSAARGLDTLGSNKWKKTRERVAKEIDRLAAELVQIYSARNALKGFAFPEDTTWQEEFEAAFEYDETPDQLKAIDEIKADMESARPMDRLVCGDVGYGKTEVALRAAFKAVMSGKQVVFIAPTTILALQHFKTLSRRFANYPVKIDWISRFRTAAQVREVRQKMTEGKLDIVVGTHAILTSAPYMNNLGLLIVDEEQRFGVGHKEAIKKIKKLVDVLTLTATPIPRTLHMSLVGIRDLSIINTPPSNRSRIETYVMEDSDDILTDAIMREIDRGGQVYYLHNRVETIQVQEARLRTLMPGVSMAILHGQLPENEIEDTLLEFQQGHYQLLITTTIIESGIDIPNVNTLIVHRADTFGLSQLYQIKGRVGRSSRQAYAYFFYPGKHAITEIAMKRLQTLQEYQELGSGFKVAMRDLEIRGAGNLLGKEQSGQIMDVGFDLYVQMLEEAVAALQGKKIRHIQTSINLNTDLYIPDDYIPDERQKVEFYQRFERCTTDAELEDIRHEMEDRFGRLPDVVHTFLAVERIRVWASGLGIDKVYEESGRIAFHVTKEHTIDPEKLVQIMSGGGDFQLNPNQQDVLYLRKKAENEQLMLVQVEKALHGLQ